MKTRKNRMISVVLALLIIMTGLPFMGMTASAEEYIGTVENSNVSWRVDTDTSTLYLYANGVMMSGNLLQSVRKIAPDVYTTSIRRVVIEEGVTAIISPGVMDTFYKVETITLPQSLRTFDEGTFENCRQLTAFIVDVENPYLKNGDDGALYSKDGKTLLVYPRGSIAASGTAVVPDGVERIDDGVFCDCSELTAITLPDSLKEIGASAFYNCTNLASLTLPEGLRKIESCALESMYALQTLHIPSSLKTIHNTSFGKLKSLTAFTCADDNETFYVADGVLFRNDGRNGVTLIAYPAASERNAYTVPEGVTVIADFAFSYAANLETISFPITLLTMEQWCLSYCTSLTSVSIPALRTMKGYIFAHDSALREVILPEGLVTLPSSVFFHVPALERVHIPSTVTTIYSDAFRDAACTICMEGTNEAAELYAETHGFPVEHCDGHSGTQTSEIASEEDLAALQARIDALLDPQQLYYYKDEAILRVAEALGYDSQDAGAFLADARANGYSYDGPNTAEAVREATDKLMMLMENGSDPYMLNAIDNTGGNVRMINRDESKAHVTIRTIPVAVNGEAVNYRNGPVEIHAGDRVQFNLYIDTDYYVSSMILPIVYDTVRFVPLDTEGVAYEPEDLANANCDELVEITAATDISRNYDTEVLSVLSFARQYPTSYRIPEIMDRYKILAIMSGTKYSRTTTVLKMDSAQYGSLLYFTLQAKEDMLYGADNACVGCVAEWYPTAEEHNEIFFSVTRAAGYLDDGVTPASSFDRSMALNRDRSDPTSACAAADLYALFGQTCVCDPGIAMNQHTHTWGEPETLLPATCCAEGLVRFTCTICGATKDAAAPVDPDAHAWGDGVVTKEPDCAHEGEMTYTCLRDPNHTDVRAIEIDPSAHTWGAWEDEDENVHIRYCAHDESHAETAAHIWVRNEEMSYPATENEEGQDVFECTICHRQRIETIPPIDSEGKLVLNGGEAIRGRTISVTVVILDNPGVTGMLLNLDYDPAVLTLNGVENGGIFADEMFDPCPDLRAIPYKTVWLDALADHTQNGTLVTFTFDVASDAPLGPTTVSISYESANIHNTELNDIPFRVQNAVIDVTLLYGDVDNDEAITLKDATVLRRFLAGWDVTINTETSDAYRDGVVNLKDATWIIRYLAGNL